MRGMGPCQRIRLPSFFAVSLDVYHVDYFYDTVLGYGRLALLSMYDPLLRYYRTRFSEPILFRVSTLNFI